MYKIENVYFSSGNELHNNLINRLFIFFTFKKFSSFLSFSSLFILKIHHVRHFFDFLEYFHHCHSLIRALTHWKSASFAFPTLAKLPFCRHNWRGTARIYSTFPNWTHYPNSRKWVFSHRFLWWGSPAWPKCSWRWSPSQTIRVFPLENSCFCFSWRGGFGSELMSWCCSS